MKRINVFLVFISILLLSANYEQPKQPQKKYYYGGGRKILLNEVPNMFVVSFNEEYISEIQTNLRNNVQILNMELGTYRNNYILTTTENANGRALMEVLRKQTGVKSVHPMYSTSEGAERGMMGEIFVQFKENVSQEEIDNIFQKYRLEIIRISSWRSHLLSVPIDLDPLEVANAIQEGGLTNFSYPHFTLKVETCQSLPTDPYFGNQYYLRNTGQTVNGLTCTKGADINITNAWSMTKGSSNIVIAVLDHGVTSNHPDIPNSRQIRLNGSNFVVTPPGNDPSPTGDAAHGDACAGIIAASHNSEGIAGIAPNCKIMPIRMLGTGNPSVIAAAIEFAANNGADVISNSWTIKNATSPNHDDEIVAAIEYATTQGRGGKGCVVVFAAGNTAMHSHPYYNSGYVFFPANVNIAGVLTVGASDRNDYQADYSPTSKLYHSLNNEIIDVVAPSSTGNGDGDVWTIDIPGSAGYNSAGYGPPLYSLFPSSGTNYLAYTGYFGGTSAACPQVAGVAALILSLNPNLTQLDVGNIIKSTARKARAGTTYLYFAQSHPNILPNVTWNERMGYGVVDASAALAAVPRISGSATVCYTGSPFSLLNPPAGTIYWKSSDINIFTVSPTTTTSNHQVTVTRIGTTSSGSVTLSAHTGSTSGPVVASMTVSACPLEITGPSSIRCGYSEMFYMPSIPGASYSWSSYYGIVYVAGSGTTAVGVAPSYLWGWSDKEVDGIVCTVNNVPYYKWVTVYEGRSPVNIYPNPVSDILNVEIEADAIAELKTTRSLNTDPTFDIRLYDSMGNLVRQNSTRSATTQFNVTNLPSGVYYLHVYNGVHEKPVVKQIVIQR